MGGTFLRTFLLLYWCGARLSFLTCLRKIRKPPVWYALPLPVTSNGVSPIPSPRAGPDKGQNTGPGGQPKTEFEIGAVGFCNPVDYLLVRDGGFRDQEIEIAVLLQLPNLHR